MGVVALGVVGAVVAAARFASGLAGVQDDVCGGGHVLQGQHLLQRRDGGTTALGQGGFNVLCDAQGLLQAFFGLLDQGVTLQVLLKGYAIGLVLALVLSVLAMTTRLGQDLLEVLTAMLNPLPAIALLPLALVWFGLGNPSIVFVLVHSVMWPVALNTHAGFQAVSNTLRMVGRNVGLTGPAYVLRILVPAAFPSILSGLKVGWAFAWRTLIAAELVFGTTSGSGGLGWFIYENKNVLDIPAVFAGLFTVIVIGLVVEGLIFRTLERATVRKWGMQA